MLTEFGGAKNCKNRKVELMAGRFSFFQYKPKFD